MASGEKSGKMMSSRLAGMKFMQRAAASSPADSSGERSSKRQRMSGGGAFDVDRENAQAIEAARMAEEAKRIELLDRQAADAGETKWVVDIPGATNKGFMTIVNAGYGMIDGHTRDEDAEERDSQSARPGMPGRKSYGDFGKQEVGYPVHHKSTRIRTLTSEQKKPAVKEDDEESNSDSDSNSADSDDFDAEAEMRGRPKVPSEATEQLRAKRQARKQAERMDLAMMADRRRNKEVKLNKMTGISSGGSQKARGSPLTAGAGAGGGKGGGGGGGMQCFRCGGPHRKADCPNAGGGKRY